MSGEYRRTVPLSTTTEYWFVEMGRRGYPLNGSDWYPFPSEAGAQWFAHHHKARDPDRDIRIRYPDGRTFGV